MPVFCLRIKDDRAHAIRKAAQQEGGRRVALPPSRMGQDGDVRIGKAMFVKRIENHQTAGVPILSPAIAVRVGQIRLQPREQRRHRRGMHEVLSTTRSLSRGTIWMATGNSPGKVSNGSSQPGSRSLPGYRSTANDV